MDLTSSGRRFFALIVECLVDNRRLSFSGFITEKEEQPDQVSQQGLTAGDSWSSATSLDRFIPPTITRSLLPTYQRQPGERLQFQVEYFSPSVQCHCTWQVQGSNETTPRSIQNGHMVNTNYSSTLTIDSITTESQGLYIFSVENVYGRASAQTLVIVDTDSTQDEQQGRERWKARLVGSDGIVCFRQSRRRLNHGQETIGRRPTSPVDQSSSETYLIDTPRANRRIRRKSRSQSSRTRWSDRRHRYSYGIRSTDTTIIHGA